jgi:hypothetical protein
MFSRTTGPKPSYALDRARLIRSGLAAGFARALLLPSGLSREHRLGIGLEAIDEVLRSGARRRSNERDDPAPMIHDPSDRPSSRINRSCLHVA